MISNCGVTVTAVNNTNAFTLANGALAAGASCNITISVLGISNGFFTNTTSTIASSAGTGLAATAPITVTNIIDPETAFQVRYVSNLNIGDSVVNLTNTGTLTLPSGLTTTGNLCVNVYTFDANEELSCAAPVW